MVLACGGIIDAVSADQANPDRLVGAVLFLFVNLLVPFFEARPPTKRRQHSLSLTYALTCIGYWCLIITWYSGWRTFRQRIATVGPMTFDVQSFSMSALLTLTVLITKFAWSAFRSAEVNPGITQHAHIAYRYKQHESQGKTIVPCEPSDLNNGKLPTDA